MEKKKYKHGEAIKIIANTLMEYGDPLDIPGILNLSGIDRPSVAYSSLQRLVGSGKVEKTDTRKVRVNKNSPKREYRWIPVEPEFDSKLTFPEEPNKSISKPYIPEKIENNYVERCYFLIKAGRSIDTDIVADFFRFSEEEANVLLRRTIHKYSDLRETVRVSIKD